MLAIVFMQLDYGVFKIYIMSFSVRFANSSMSLEQDQHGRSAMEGTDGLLSVHA